MDIGLDLRTREFIGKIVPIDTPEGFYDEKQQGRYRVHIPELMPMIEYKRGIWCKNQTHKWRITPSDIGDYGSYFPLHAGTYVLIKFYENDLNTGYIDRIISDYKPKRDYEAQDNTKEKRSLEDRDEQYVLLKTPKKWTALYINEDTSYEPNTVYLIYNRDKLPERRTVMRIDETGQSFWTRDCKYYRIGTDYHIQVDNMTTELYKGYRTTHVGGREDVHFWEGRWTEYNKIEHKLNHCKRLKTLKSSISSGNPPQVDPKYKPGTSRETSIADAKLTPHHERKPEQHTPLPSDPPMICQDPSEHVYIEKDKFVYIGNEEHRTTDNNFIRSVTNRTSITNGGVHETYSATKITLDAPTIHLNCGMFSGKDATEPEQAEGTKPLTNVRDLGPKETGEYEIEDTLVENRPTIRLPRCDDVTDQYNVGKRDNERMIE